MLTILTLSPRGFVLHVRSFCDACEVRELEERGIGAIKVGQVVTHRQDRAFSEELRHSEGEMPPWCDGSCEEAQPEHVRRRLV